jgi:hypothetical protein
MRPLREPLLRAQARGPAGDWLSACERLFAIPEPYRDEYVNRADARQTLRCDDALLDRLIAHGLPCGGAPGDERFDHYDLFNLALDSRSGRSMPEMAFQFALRWMSGAAERWLEPRSWTMSVGLQCGRDACGAEPSWSIARPRPDLFGGWIEDLRVTPTTHAADDEIACRGDGGLALSCEVHTVGRRMQLRNRRLREIVTAFMHAGHRWIRMPEGLQRQDALVLSHGVSNCISASLHLERELLREGFEVRTRRGWMLGMLDIEHAWIEVRDDDGEVKAVDPIFALLSTHAPESNAELEQVVMGSRLNRLLPTLHTAGEPLARHCCDGCESPIRKTTVIRAVRGSAAAQPVTVAANRREVAA